MKPSFGPVFLSVGRQPENTAGPAGTVADHASMIAMVAIIAIGTGDGKTKYPKDVDAATDEADLRLHKCA